MIRVANRDARSFVSNKREFKGNNTYGKWENENIYIVYSYGEHWILFIWDGKHWLACNEKYHRPTTNKHKNQLNPFRIEYEFSQKELQQIKRKLLN